MTDQTTAAPAPQVPPASAPAPQAPAPATPPPAAPVSSPAEAVKQSTPPPPPPPQVDTPYDVIASLVFTALPVGSVNSCLVGSGLAPITTQMDILKTLASPPVAPTNSSPPVVSGNTSVGSVLTCDPGTWTGGAAITYQWQGNATDIAGSTGVSYTTVAGDIGTNITCVVTGTNASGSASATSNSIGPIA